MKFNLFRITQRSNILAANNFYNPATEEYALMNNKSGRHEVMREGEYLYIDEEEIKRDFISLPIFDPDPIWFEFFKRYEDVEPRYEEIINSEDPLDAMLIYLEELENGDWGELLKLVKEAAVEVVKRWCDEHGFEYYYQVPYEM